MRKDTFRNEQVREKERSECAKKNDGAPVGRCRKETDGKTAHQVLKEEDVLDRSKWKRDIHNHSGDLR